MGAQCLSAWLKIEWLQVWASPVAQRCPWARHINPCLVPVSTWLQNCWLQCKESNQTNKQKSINKK